MEVDNMNGNSTTVARSVRKLVMVATRADAREYTRSATMLHLRQTKTGELLPLVGLCVMLTSVLVCV